VSPKQLPHFLTVKQVAAALDITSPATIRNWLEYGSFPRTIGRGRWRLFHRSGVRLAMERIAQIEADNAAGNLAIPDYDEPRSFLGRLKSRLFSGRDPLT
jgi:hypothetical protein